MYLAAGFSPYRESERHVVVRKPLPGAAIRSPKPPSKGP
jgi:hypothetical protein